MEEVDDDESNRTDCSFLFFRSPYIKAGSIGSIKGTGTIVRDRERERGVKLIKRPPVIPQPVLTLLQGRNTERERKR